MSTETITDMLQTSPLNIYTVSTVNRDSFSSSRQYILCVYTVYNFLLAVQYRMVNSH